MNIDKGLIFACDLRQKEKALEITEKIKEHIDAVKVNYPLILSTGIDIISELSKHVPVIADFKIADVPHINEIISEIAFKNNCSGVICHSFLGKESLMACKEKAKKFDSEIYSVVEMSHKGSKKFIHNHYEEFCELANEVNVDGVVAPGNDASRLRDVKKLVGENTKILSPGIGFQGGKTKEALRAGADYVIVGRKIYQSKEPKNVAKKLKKKIIKNRNDRN